MPTSRPKLLHITRNYPPLLGGMERLNWRMSQELSKSYEVHVVAPNGATEHTGPNITVQEIPVKPLWCFLLFGLWQSLRQAKRIQPTIILAGSGLTAPLAWLAARMIGARTVVIVYGLDLVVSHPIYRAFWLPAIRRMDIVVAISQATAKIAEDNGIASSRISIVHPGVDLPEQTETKSKDFRSQYDLEKASIMLSVGRLAARKGLREFVSDVLPMIVLKRPDACLVIVGDIATQALSAESQTPQSIMQAAVRAGVETNVRFLGKLPNEDLLNAYSAADVHVFPVRELPNDLEGFGMVAIEAAAHGVPTVAYAVGGVPDAVAEGISGRLIAPNDAVAFAAAVLDMLHNPLSKDSVREFAGQFAWDRFGSKLLQAFGSLKNRKEKF